MKNFPKSERLGHESWNSEDKLLEWKEPAIIRTTKLSSEILACVIALPILFPIFGVAGFFMFALKVRRSEHSLKELSWGSLVLISLILAAVFSLFMVIKVVLQNISPTTVRLASTGIGKWKWGWGREFSCAYKQVRRVQFARHDLVPEVSAIRVVLKSGDPVYLAGSDEEIVKALEIFRQQGVRCDIPAKFAA